MSVNSPQGGASEAVGGGVLGLGEERLRGQCVPLERGLQDVLRGAPGTFFLLGWVCMVTFTLVRRAAQETKQAVTGHIDGTWSERGIGAGGAEAVGRGLEPQVCHLQVLILRSLSFLVCQAGLTIPSNVILAGAQ